MSYTQDNIEALFELIGGFSGQSFRRENHFDIITTTDSIWPNQLINPDFTHQADLALEELENKVKSKELPGLIMCSPESDPKTLQALEDRGYRRSAWTAMSYPTNKLCSLERPEGLEISEVNTELKMKLWLMLAETELMGGHALNEKIFLQLMQNESCTFFLASINSEVVATSFLFSSSKSAGIYLVATHSSHRKKGIGKYMTWLCMQKALEPGCQRIDLQATALGRGVYASLGFEEQGEIPVFSIQI